MNSLPTHVRISYSQFHVQPMTAAEADEVGDGCCNLRDCVIKVNTTQSWQRQVETLWHEVKHAIHAHADLTDESKEEDFCTRAAPYELAVLVHNPKLVACILSVCPAS